MSWDLLWWAMGVLIVILIAVSLVSTTAHQKDPVSPAGSSWPSTNPGSRESVNPVVDSDVGVRAPWVRSAPGALLAGQQAELAVRNMLVDGLPAGTWVLSGLTLPGLGGDIDLLIVGALGAVVLEVKYCAGRIVCGQAGHAWVRERRGLIETMSDPARQLESEVAALAAFWRRNGYSVASAVGGLLVFAHPRCRLEVAASRVPITRPGRALDSARLPGPTTPVRGRAGAPGRPGGRRPTCWLGCTRGRAACIGWGRALQGAGRGLARHGRCRALLLGPGRPMTHYRALASRRAVKVQLGLPRKAGHGRGSLRKLVKPNPTPIELNAVIQVLERVAYQLEREPPKG